MVKVTPHPLANRVQAALVKMPAWSLSGCGISLIDFKDLGESAEYHPNHGYYIGGMLVLNHRMEQDSTVFKDASSGKACPILEFVLYHEIGHGYDEFKGGLSEHSEWLALSGWSKVPGPGLQRITIVDEGRVTEGEWCFDPSLEGFSRYYGMRNPWDDFADCFSFYIMGMHGFLPAKKKQYFDKQAWLSRSTGRQ